MKGPTPVDTAWFKARLTDKGYSQRGLAKMLDIDHSALSLMFSGKRKMSVQEAGSVASLLDVPIGEVLKRAGVAVRVGDVSVPVRGTVGGAGDLAGTRRAVAAPADMGSETVAIRIDEPGALHHGWVLFYYPSDQVLPEAVGRLSVVRVDDRETIGFVARGLDEGTYSVTPLQGPTTGDVRLRSATPVRWIRT